MATFKTYLKDTNEWVKVMIIYKIRFIVVFKCKDISRKAVWESVRIFKVELSTTLHYQQLLNCHCLHHHYSVTDVIFIVDVIIVHILHIVICSCCEGTHLAVTTLVWNTHNRQLFTFSWLCTPTQSSSVRSPIFVRDYSNMMLYDVILFKVCACKSIYLH